jgi:nicotinamidase-related amidase
MKRGMLLVMDMMNDLVHEDGPAAKSYVPLLQERNVLHNARRAIDRARKAGLLVGYVRVGFSADYRECPPSSPVFSRARDNGMFKLGTWGTEIHPELKPANGDFDIVKHRVSPFYATSLEAVLRAHDVGRLYLCGVSTNGVVHAAVREGHDRDYACTVLEDCCCGATPEEHDTALKSMARFASAIKSSQDVEFT